MIHIRGTFSLGQRAIRFYILVVVTASMVTDKSLAQNQSIRVAQTRVAKVFGTGGLSRLESWQTATAISDDGLFVTAWSYVLDSGATVVLDDGRRFTAELIGHHPQMELALLKIDVAEQPHFELNQNRITESGEPVFALTLGDARVVEVQFGIARIGKDERVSLGKFVRQCVRTKGNAGHRKQNE